MLRHAIAAAIAAALTPMPAAAEMELSLYLGWQGVSDSTASGRRPDGTGFNRTIDWDADPFENPPYYGGRAIWWTPRDLGFGVEGTHTKALASAGDLTSLGMSSLELSDGHNVITANVMKRWPDVFAETGLTPYLGGGVGVAIPHVDIQIAGASNRTFGFETTGPAVRGIAGLKYALNDRWAVFGEYQVTWSDNDITIDPDPTVAGQTAGQLDTEITTHALNVGVSYSF